MKTTLLSYVASVLDNYIVIECEDKTKFRFLRTIGAKRLFIVFGSRWYLRYDSITELAGFFSQLRDEGFPFSHDEHGWGPAEIFDHRRKQGYLCGKFIEIAWYGPNKTITREL